MPGKGSVSLDELEWGGEKTKKRAHGQEGGRPWARRDQEVTFAVIITFDACGCQLQSWRILQVLALQLQPFQVPIKRRPVDAEQTRCTGQIAAGGAISLADFLGIEFERPGGTARGFPGGYEFSL